MPKQKLDFSYYLPTDERNKIDEVLKKHSIEDIMTSMIDAPVNPELSNALRCDKNSYEFWGNETSKIVKTPETLFLPMSLNAYKISGAAELNFTNPLLKRASMELILSAVTIAKWSEEKNLNEFFLKNANFSSKHRWPFTCNVDFSHIQNITFEKKVEKIMNHMYQINSDAILCWSKPGLGWVARKKLDLEPFFFAFGRKFFSFKDTKTGEINILSTSASYNAHKQIEKWWQKHNNMSLQQTFHIGMPITKEIRIFSFNGEVAGYCPYWSPISFKNQEIYDLPKDKTLEDVLKILNSFEKSDIDHLYKETAKIIQHPKFNDTNWAIDWIKTRNGTWYMTDMQTAETSFMDFDNMKFADASGETNTIIFLRDRLNQILNEEKNMQMIDKLLLNIRGKSHNINTTLKKFGYPNQERIVKLYNQLGTKQK